MAIRPFILLYGRPRRFYTDYSQTIRFVSALFGLLRASDLRTLASTTALMFVSAFSLRSTNLTYCVARSLLLEVRLGMQFVKNRKLGIFGMGHVGKITE